MNELEIFAKTVFAETRGEPEEGQLEVAKLIKRRADMNRSFWGGPNVSDVCRQPGQFECWDGVDDIPIKNTDRPTYERIRKVCSDLLSGRMTYEADGPDEYLNPSKEGYPMWVLQCRKLYVVGSHTFYRSRGLFSNDDLSNRTRRSDSSDLDDNDVPLVELDNDPMYETDDAKENQKTNSDSEVGRSPQLVLRSDRVIDINDITPDLASHSPPGHRGLITTITSTTAMIAFLIFILYLKMHY